MINFDWIIKEIGNQKAFVENKKEEEEKISAHTNHTMAVIGNSNAIAYVMIQESR